MEGVPGSNPGGPMKKKPSGYRSDRRCWRILGVFSERAVRSEFAIGFTGLMGSVWFPFHETFKGISK
ncbi:MAG: hypothetical protein EBR01_13785 [Proteobacteria bacterium]|nr:hypothetical protein [Pseudomonadota bacterium]